MTSIIAGYNARGVWLPASGAPTHWLSASGAGASVYGTSGNDCLTTGGGGSTAYGGLGDDSYYVYDSSDHVVEYANQGIDTLNSYVSAYLLPDNVENMVVWNANTSGTGNAQANIIVGGAGSQTLDGGAGDDILTGGSGADLFLMQGGTGWDLITDFENGIDRVALGGAFTQFTSFATVTAAMSQVGGDTVLALSATDAVTFQGKTLGAFTAMDFVLPEAALMASLRPTFGDEFSSFAGTPTGLDASGRATWATSYMYGTRTLSANKEVEYYTDATIGPNPFSLDPTGSGALRITAAPTANLPSGLTYSSGVITTETSDVQTYGFFEIRAQVPAGAGFWPAFWLLRADGTGPSELDVMEILGNAPGTVHASIHSQTAAANLSDSYATQDLSLGYHTYALSWRPDSLTFYLDGTAIASVATPADMHSPMYMIANLAVGGVGSWAGPTDGTSSAVLAIDSIKAYQFADLAGPYRPPEVHANLALGTWGADTLVGTSGDDRFEDFGGSDILTGGGGSNVFAFGQSDGTDTITDFHSGVDKILAYGTSSVGVAASTAGLVVTFSPWNTVTLQGVTALATGDIVYGDQVAGTTGNDLIDRSGTSRPQWISASTGADTVTGGAGDDFILGGQGDDILTGGPGADTFAFAAWDGHDRITDFTSGIDRIMFRGIAAQTVWVNPSHDAAGNTGLEIDYAVGQSIFLPGLTSLASGDIIFSV